MSDKDTLPDWYPAPIHQNQLSLKEWAEELNVRTFFFEYLQNPKKDPRKIAQKHDALSVFIEVVIDGQRNKVLREFTPPLFHIPTDEEKDEGLSIYKFNRKQFGEGFTQPIMINLDYDNVTLKEHFEEFLTQAKEALEYKEFHAFVFKNMFEGEEFSRKFKHTPQSKGRTPYTEKHAEDWFKFKVLDWIDLKLWCVISETPIYSKKILEDAFWNEHIIGGHNLNKTTIPWARELLSPKVNKLIQASANRHNKINFHTYL